MEITNNKMRKIAKIFQVLSYWPTRLILKFFFHHKIKGLENLKEFENKPIIFASNHLSFVDPLLVATSVPINFLPIRFLATERLYKLRNLFIILFIWLHGSIKIRKYGGDLETALKEVVLVLKRGEKVWIFPEGKRTNKGEFGQGKRGVAYLHKETGAPIVPVAIIGKSRVVFGKPIYSLGECSFEEGANKVMSAIKKLMI